MDKKCSCGMPIDEKTCCSCSPDLCYHCCECGAGCEDCGCSEK